MRSSEMEYSDTVSAEPFKAKEKDDLEFSLVGEVGTLAPELRQHFLAVSPQRQNRRVHSSLVLLVRVLRFPQCWSFLPSCRRTGQHPIRALTVDRALVWARQLVGNPSPESVPR